VTREAGGLPLEGTTLSWDLLKVNADGNDDVVLDSSSNYQEDFVTPENGVVTIPLQVGGEVLETNGISGQSKLALRIRPSKESTGSFTQVGGTKGHCTNAAHNVNYNYLSFGGMASLRDCQRTCLSSKHNSFVGVEFSEGAEQKECNCLYSGSSLPQCADFPSLLDPTIGDMSSFRFAASKVRIQHNAVGWINIVEVEVYSEGTKVALQETSSSEATLDWGTWGYSREGGSGFCLDSQDRRFNHKWIGSSTPEDCAASCHAQGDLVFHTGFSLWEGHKCLCEYTAGQGPVGWTGGNGVGPVAGAGGDVLDVCYRYVAYGVTGENGTSVAVQ